MRVDGVKEPMSIHGRNLAPMGKFDRVGLSVRRAQLGRATRPRNSAAQLGRAMRPRTSPRRALTPPNPPPQVPALRSFRAAHSALLPNLTTDQAKLGVLMPLTAGCASSLAAALARANAKDEAGVPLTAPATVFVVADDESNLVTASLAILRNLRNSAQLFSDCPPPFQTLDLVDAWAMTQPKPEEVFVWLEPLCTDLHRPTEAGPLWWGSVFKGGVKEIGRTLLLLDPWENAPVLRRSWSLYHLHCTLASKDTELEMTMSDDAADRLQTALIDDMTVWRTRSTASRTAAGGSSPRRRRSSTRLSSNE